KSSVSNTLKEYELSSPVGRRTGASVQKEKFKIPTQRKEQIRKNLEKEVSHFILKQDEKHGGQKNDEEKRNEISEIKENLSNEIRKNETSEIQDEVVSETKKNFTVVEEENLKIGEEHLNIEEMQK